MSSENDKPAPDNRDETEAMAETHVLHESELGAPESAEGSGSPEQQLLDAQAEAQENWNKYLRAVAEQDNLRKRHARELEKARNFGVEGLATELLNVADSLEMGLEAAESATVEALVTGKRATLKQLQTALEKHGVTPIYPEGEPFDPELHEAMTMQPSTTAEPNTVLAVVQRGYQLNGRLLRPARVIVAREPDEPPQGE